MRNLFIWNASRSAQETDANSRTLAKYVSLFILIGKFVLGWMLLPSVRILKKLIGFVRIVEIIFQRMHTARTIHTLGFRFDVERMAAKRDGRSELAGPPARAPASS